MRFVRVQDKTKHNMTCVTKHYATTGNAICTDEFRAHKGLDFEGYNLRMVNRPEDYVDPVSEAHTQEIECAWVYTKNWNKRALGNRELLQSK